MRIFIFVAAVLSLFAVLVWVYQDSFRHTPKRDQLYYLLETSRSQSFSEILAESWSYNRTRTVQPGDMQLFRPGLFVLLAVQNYLFDYHYEYTRWVSLIIHAVVACLLFWLLYLLAQPFYRELFLGKVSVVALPLAFTLLFTFSCTIFDTVSWEHIQGYMVFVGLVLLSLVRFLKFERSEVTPVLAVAGIWLPLFVAAFFHEAAVGFAAIFGLCAGLIGRCRRAWSWKLCFAVFALFLAIPVIYLSASFADYRFHADRLVAENFSENLQLGTSLPGTLYNYLRFVVYCCIQPLVPFILSFEEGIPIGIRDFFYETLQHSRQPLELQIILVGLLGCLVFFVGNWVVRATRRKEIFPLLVLALLGAFVSLYVILRLNVRTQFSYSLLGVNSQYVYICLPLTLCLIFSAILDFLSRRSADSRRRWIRWIIVYALAASIYGGVQTWNCNRSAAEACVDVRNKFLVPGTKALDTLKAEGKSRVQFVFENPVDFAIYSHFGVPITTIFFGRHEVEEHPDALISLPSGQVLPPDGRKSPFYVETLPYDVVTVRKHGKQIEFYSSYAVYREGQNWMGILCSYPLSTLDRVTGDPFTVTAASREEIVKKSAEAAGLARREASEGRLLLGIAGLPLKVKEHRGWTLMRISDRYVAIPGTGLEGKEIRQRMLAEGGLLNAGSKESLEAQIDLLKASER